jgi:Holliday junction resolvase-like predicted endonuclease
MSHDKKTVNLKEASYWSHSLSAFIYRVRGYEVRARNYITPQGNIDLVLVKKDKLKFTLVMTLDEPLSVLEDIEDIDSLLSDEFKQSYKKATEFFLEQNPSHKRYKKQINIFVISSPFSWKVLENVV